MFKQIKLYGFLPIVLAINLIACANGNNAAAMLNKATANTKTSEQATNYQSNQTPQTAAPSDKKSTTKDQCATWTDVKAADKAGKISFSDPDNLVNLRTSTPSRTMPELPAGFKNGCVYVNDTSNVGPHTLELIVLKDGLRLTPVPVDNNDPLIELFRIIPPSREEDEVAELEQKGQTRRIDFYSDGETLAAAGGDETTKHAKINKDRKIVFFGYQSMQSNGVPLEEMARLLEATKPKRKRGK